MDKSCPHEYKKVLSMICFERFTYYHVLITNTFVINRLGVAVAVLGGYIYAIGKIFEM